ncbi:MAG TPA: DUF2807 domain-containing protein, partial [Candidatus Alistipes excrementipullorum]|nr:DUF2807 domain-containing protein [Candidatus Alistipes excrementipullorum]
TKGQHTACRTGICLKKKTQSIETYGNCECTTAEIDCSGGSVFHGYDLAVESAEVENSGGSRIELSVMQSFTGENSGGSVISYKGSPSILNVNNSGGSQTVKEE